MGSSIAESNIVNNRLSHLLSDFGFESHVFLVDWYNQLVSTKFQLKFDPATVGCVVISQPSMFEKAFLPFIQQNYDSTQIHDPIDQCMMHYFNLAKTALRSDYPEIKCLHDFEMDSRRRPRILVQTAGHVSGAVRYYKPSDMEIELGNNNYFPVCHHPRWGGWFALRGVMIFPDIQDPDLVKKEPEKLLSESEAGEMLRLYNTQWQDWRWRDVGDPEERYSETQIKYFETPPAHRFKLIDSYMSR